jgi:hypothetical protein
VTKIAKSAKAPDLGVKMSGTPETGQTVTIGHEAALQKIFGTKHPEMAEALLGHCLKVLMSSEASDDHPGSDERLFMLAAVEEIKPRDALERMLAVQMAATHVAMIRQGRRMAHAEQLPQFEAHERAYNKLARTFTAQVEALRKHRTGGKQTVTVQHVNVSEGGQAIVGNVQARGRGNDGK